MDKWFDFGPLITGSGLDYRVIVISRYGDSTIAVGESEHPLCIEAPLSDVACLNPASDPLDPNPPRFYHYSANVGQDDSWCVLLDSFDKRDEYVVGGGDREWSPLAPNGWRAWLRPSAFKAFGQITSNKVGCQVVDTDPQYEFDDLSTVDAGVATAALFDTALLELSPGQFGTAAERNYIWHGIIGMEPDAVVTDAWPPSAPISTQTCDNALLGSQGEEPGTGYQALSVLTAGLRYPICYENDYSELYGNLTTGVVVEEPAPCLFAAPSAGNGEYDPLDSSAAYHPGGDEAASVELPLVPSASACGVNGWYWFDEASTIISLCPLTCDEVQADPAAVIRMSLGCPKAGTTYGQIYEATCPDTETAHWTFLHFETTIAGDAVVRFRARTSNTDAGLVGETFINIAEASIALDTVDCASGSSNEDACPVRLFDGLGGQRAGIRAFLELEGDAFAGSHFGEPQVGMSEMRRMDAPSHSHQNVFGRSFEIKEPAMFSWRSESSDGTTNNGRSPRARRARRGAHPVVDLFGPSFIGFVDAPEPAYTPHKISGRQAARPTPHGADRSRELLVGHPCGPGHVLDPLVLPNRHINPPRPNRRLCTARPRLRDR